MASFDYAHLQIQGHTFLFVIVQEGVTPTHFTALQTCAATAKLCGQVVPVWPKAGDNFGYLAPPQVVPLLKTLRWENIVLNINGKLICG